MNGCIWDQEVGKGIKQVHRGKLDLKVLKGKIVENLQKQIPLLPVGIQMMLDTRNLKTNVNAKPVIGQLALDYGFSQGQATGILNAYGEEVRVTPEYKDTLFAVINGVTRAGQKFSNADWVNADKVAGQLVNYGPNDWSSLTTRAAALKADDVDELFAS
jgi:hypothetical protein